jgi:secondary thiamine-phosphate synthase enzyme
MKEIRVQSKKKKEIINITDIVNQEIDNNKFDEGVCILFVKHTTAALTTADLDPGTDLDMLDAFDKIIPELNYRHPHDPAHVPDHILSSIIGGSVTIPVRNGLLGMGTWQNVVLVELSGPRTREISMNLIKTI